MAPPWQMPRPRRRLPGLTGNALVTAVISAIVSGGISLGLAFYQSGDAARQALETQQVQQAGQLEAAASALYQEATDVYNFQLTCAPRGSISWRQCASIAPNFNNYAVANTTFGADSLNITDRQASQLAASFSTAAVKTIGAASVKTAKSEWNTMVDQYTSLQARCAQIIQGRA